MVDEVRLLRLLRGVSDDIAVLDAEAYADDVRRSDPLWMRGIKYTFVTAIEACVDVAQHICSAEGWGPPEDNGHAIQLLGARQVLAADLAASMRRAVGFRNVLVHEYVDVSDDIVVARLGDRTDLIQFVRQATAYVTSEQ
ncbi:MAG: DUF86 domain-containing protein [Nocardioidaceae bacterium]|nr:DUF86 domain-containing protein [Nocardioidaceae bacterium]